MRDLIALIEVIKKLVPEDFEHREELFNALDDRADSVRYTAPEMLPERFGEVGGILGAFLGDPADGWRKTIAEIYSAKLDYKNFL